MIEQTIMSQYANSPRLMSIITSLWEAIDPQQFTDDFYTLVMDIPNANSYGLDIWGRIVGIGRTVNSVNPSGQYFGFIDGFYPFNEQPFSAPGSGTDTWELGNDAYRELILLKALSNIVYATAPNINALLRAMFSGPCYCLLTGPMQMRYVFEFELSSYQHFLVYNSGILPRPSGVDLSIIISADPSGIFGFYGSGLQPFGQGVFYNVTA